MISVSIIGAGKMGQSIAELSLRAGASVQMIRRSAGIGKPADRPGVEYADFGDDVTGGLVVLAVPYEAYPDILENYGDRFNGKVVIEISNPIDFTTYDELKVPPDSSAAVELAKRLPVGVPVVKAFNVNLGDTLSTGTNGMTATAVLFAGDDPEAKIAVAELVEAAGMRAVDVGQLSRARELEAMGFLQIMLAAIGKTHYESGFTLLH